MKKALLKRVQFVGYGVCILHPKSLNYFTAICSSENECKSLWRLLYPNSTQKMAKIRKIEANLTRL